MLVRRKDIEQPVECAGSISGMERSQNQMSSLRGRDRERDCLKVAHFTEHDHIWIFTKRSTERGSERAGVSVHFALSDVTRFRLEHVFDRVFQGNNMLAPLHVYLLD